MERRITFFFTKMSDLSHFFSHMNNAQNICINNDNECKCFVLFFLKHRFAANLFMSEFSLFSHCMFYRKLKLKDFVFSPSHTFSKFQQFYWIMLTPLCVYQNSFFFFMEILVAVFQPFRGCVSHKGGLALKKWINKTQLHI